MHKAYWFGVCTSGPNKGLQVLTSIEFKGTILDGYPAPFCPMCKGQDAHRLQVIGKETYEEMVRDDQGAPLMRAFSVAEDSMEDVTTVWGND